MSGSPSGGQGTAPSAEEGNFFTRIVKERSLSTLGCLAGILAGSYISYQLIKLVLWGVSKILSLLLVNLCTLYPFPFCYWVVPKWVAPVISGIVVLLTIGPILAYAPSMISSAAVPKFELERQVTGNGMTLEVRKYDAMSVAEMDAPGDTVRDRMSFSFARLTNYLTGRNVDNRTRRSVRLGMSGMIMMKSPANGKNTASLILPSAPSYPIPMDNDIYVRTIPPTRYAVVSYVGALPNDQELKDRVEAVRALAQQFNMKVKDEPIVGQVLSQLKTEIFIPMEE